MTTPRDPQSQPAPARNFITRREAVDAYFDGELSRRSPLVRDAIRDNPADQQRLEQTERILDELSAPIQTPDLTLSILDDVHMLRPFQPPAPPLWRTVARWTAIAASILLAVGGYVMLQSLAPANRETASRAARSDSVASAPPAVRSTFDTPSNAANRPARTLDMGSVAVDAQSRRWDTALDRTGLDEGALSSLQPQAASSSLASSLSRDLGLTMKPSITSGWSAAGTNLSFRRDPFPVPPSAWLRRPVKGPPLMDLAKVADPRASAWFAPGHQAPLAPK